MLRLAGSAMSSRLSVISLVLPQALSFLPMSRRVVCIVCSLMRPFPREQSGTYHLAASGTTSWHGFAQFILDEACRHGVKLRATAKNVLAIPTSEYPLPAKRPANSQLATEKIRNSFNLELPPWQLHAKRALAEIVSSNELTPKKYP